MAEVTRWIDRRSIPEVGPDVHLYDLPGCIMVVLFRDRLIETQQIFGSHGEAAAYARRLANENRCALIEHHGRANT
jgi:hypothetical protein